MNDKGAALPMAVFGLLILSLLATSALSSAGMELTMSRAHLEGVRGLYSADSAVETFVASRANATWVSDTPLSEVVSVGSSGDGPFEVQFTSLHRRSPHRLPDGGLEQVEILGVLASPRDGWGRAAGALIEASRAAVPVTLGIDAALTAGGPVSIADGAVVSGSPAPGTECDIDDGTPAIRHITGSLVTLAPGGIVEGAMVESSDAASDVIIEALAGWSIHELAGAAEIGFGPLHGEGPIHSAPGQWSVHENLRWGCPATLVSDCVSEAATLFPVVAIDTDGIPVEISGGHGQGVLIVTGGDLHLSNGFRFAGIVIVEGRLNALDGVRLEGAVIVAGDITESAPGTPATELSGTASIRFNRCAVSKGIESLTARSLEGQPWSLSSPTFSWFEIIR